MVKQAADVVQKIGSLPAAKQELLAAYLSAHFNDVLDESRDGNSFFRVRLLRSTNSRLKWTRPSSFVYFP